MEGKYMFVTLLDVCVHTHHLFCILENFYLKKLQIFMLLEKHISLLKCGPVIYFKLEMEQNGPEIENKKTDLLREKSGYNLVPEFAIY